MQLELGTKLPIPPIDLRWNAMPWRLLFITSWSEEEHRNNLEAKTAMLALAGAVESAELGAPAFSDGRQSSCPRSIDKGPVVSTVSKQDRSSYRCNEPRLRYPPGTPLGIDKEDFFDGPSRGSEIGPGVYKAASYLRPSAISQDDMVADSRGPLRSKPRLSR